MILEHMSKDRRFPSPPLALVVTLVSRKLVGTQANSELVALVVRSVVLSPPSSTLIFL